MTSYARIELYKAMHFVGPERLIYVDTDCVIAKEGPQWLSLSVGHCLGDFKSGIGKEEIPISLCGGAKTYAYRTNNNPEVFKVKGITLNRSNAQIFEPETLQLMLDDPDLIRVIMNPMKIFRIKDSWKLESRPQEKIFRFAFDECVIMDDYDTLPFGYCQ